MVKENVLRNWHLGFLCSKIQNQHLKKIKFLGGPQIVLFNFLKINSELKQEKKIWNFFEGYD